MKFEVKVHKDYIETEIIIKTNSQIKVNKILNKLEGDFKGEYIFLNIPTGSGYERIPTREITYIEIYGSDLEIHLLSGEVIKIKGRLYQILEDLNPGVFIQITKSSVVNTDYIRKIESTFSGNMSAILRTGKSVVISRRYWKNLKELLFEKIEEEENE